MYYLIEIVIIRLNRLGWTQEKIAEIVGLSQNRISEIIGNTNFGEIDNLLSQGRAMDYIAVHYHMDIALGEIKNGLDEKLFSAVKIWLSEEWWFTTIAFPGRQLSWQEWESLPDK